MALLLNHYTKVVEPLSLIIISMKLIKSIIIVTAAVLVCVSCAHKSNDTHLSESNDALSIDTTLQSFTDLVLKDHSGCIVAIEPNTGEIKCMSSSKSDCNALSFEFAPGRVYQPIQAMIALEEGVIDSATRLPASFSMGGFRLDCLSNPGSADFRTAMEQHNEAYFAWCFVFALNKTKYADVQSAYASWIEYANSMGLGKPFGVDTKNETGGLIPSRSDYARKFRTEKWKPINVIHDAIGKGDIRVTPIQMANLAAIIANRGYYLTPHLSQGARKESQKNQSRISPEVYNLMAGLMKRETKDGAGYCCFGDTLGYSKENYTVSMGYYPVENPRITFCCYLDNDGIEGFDANALLEMLVTHCNKRNGAHADDHLDKRLSEYTSHVEI